MRKLAVDTAWLDNLAAPLHLVKDTSCPECRGRGWIKIKAADGPPSIITGAGYEFTVPCTCRAPKEPTDADLRAMLAACGVAERDIDSGLEPWNPEHADQRGKVPTPWPERVDVWWEQQADQHRRGEILTIYGPTGGGKSKVAAMLTLRAIRARVRGGVEWRYAGSLTTTLWARDPETGSDAPGRAEQADLIECGLLVLDDLLKLRGPAAYEHAEQIIDARYRARRPTIITANGKAGAVFEMPSSTLSSRIGSGWQVAMAPARDIRDLRAAKARGAKK